MREVNYSISIWQIVEMILLVLTESTITLFMKVKMLV